MCKVIPWLCLYVLLFLYSLSWYVSLRAEFLFVFVLYCVAMSVHMGWACTYIFIYIYVYRVYAERVLVGVRVRHSLTASAEKCVGKSVWNSPVHRSIQRRNVSFDTYQRRPRWVTLGRCREKEPRTWSSKDMLSVLFFQFYIYTDCNCYLKRCFIKKKFFLFTWHIKIFSLLFFMLWRNN